MTRLGRATLLRMVPLNLLLVAWIGLLGSGALAFARQDEATPAAVG